ncbi:MAG: class I SAM-dependent methyltransferase, partial [Spirochaetaceae bacterium]|nr:class I SAM-dependent methyltransferase [Spirochaetaceae bacterium]
MTFICIPDPSTSLRASLELTSCPICGPDPAQDLRYDFAPYRVVRCSRCGLVFLSPRLTESAILNLYSDQEYYVSEVAGQGYDEYLEVRHNWIKTFTRRLDQITNYQLPGKALDIGCGPGFFLEAAQAKGYDAFGLDPSEYIVKVAREKFGERVQLGLIESADYPADHFDLVVAFDTFEHIYHPLEWLSAVRRVLRSPDPVSGKPGGLLAITTPDPSSLLAKASGKKWVSFKIPEHVFYWSPSTIRRVLADGWDILEIRPAGQYASLGFLLRRLFRLPSNPRGLIKSVLDLLS